MGSGWKAGGGGGGHAKGKGGTPIATGTTLIGTLGPDEQGVIQILDDIAKKPITGVAIPSDIHTTSGFVDPAVAGNIRDVNAAVDRADAFLRQQSQAQWDRLSAVEKDAVRAYTESFNNIVNRHLGQSLGDVEKAAAAIARNANSRAEEGKFRNLLDALAKGVLPVSTVLYRRTNPRNIAGSIFKSLPVQPTASDFSKLVGQRFTDHAAQSSSADPSFGASSGTHFRIHAPAGLPGQYLGNSERRSSTPGEAEFVIKPGQSYVITGVKETPHGGIQIDIRPESR